MQESGDYRPLFIWHVFFLYPNRMVQIACALSWVTSTVGAGHSRARPIYDLGANTYTEACMYVCVYVCYECYVCCVCMYAMNAMYVVYVCMHVHHHHHHHHHHHLYLWTKGLASLSSAAFAMASSMLLHNSFSRPDSIASASSSTFLSRSYHHSLRSISGHCHYHHRQHRPRLFLSRRLIG